MGIEVMERQTTKPRKQLSLGAERALRVLQSGGYFRAMKSNARNYEGYYTRLHFSDGEIVPNAGHSELQELLDAGDAKARDGVVTGLWGRNREYIEKQIYPHTLSHQPAAKEIIYTLALPLSTPASTNH